MFSGPDFVLTLAGVRLCGLSGPDFVLTLAGVNLYVFLARFCTYVGGCESVLFFLGTIIYLRWRVWVFETRFCTYVGGCEICTALVLYFGW